MNHFEDERTTWHDRVTTERAMLRCGMFSHVGEAELSASLDVADHLSRQGKDSPAVESRREWKIRWWASIKGDRLGPDFGVDVVSWLAYIHGTVCALCHTVGMPPRIDPGDDRSFERYVSDSLIHGANVSPLCRQCRNHYLTHLRMRGWDGNRSRMETILNDDQCAEILCCMVASKPFRARVAEAPRLALRFPPHTFPGFQPWLPATDEEWAAIQERENAITAARHAAIAHVLGAAWP